MGETPDGYESPKRLEETMVRSKLDQETTETPGILENKLDIASNGSGIRNIKETPAIEDMTPRCIKIQIRTEN